MNLRIRARARQAIFARPYFSPSEGGLDWTSDANTGLLFFLRWF